VALGFGNRPVGYACCGLICLGENLQARALLYGSSMFVVMLMTLICGAEGTSGELSRPKVRRNHGKKSPFLADPIPPTTSRKGSRCSKSRHEAQGALNNERLQLQLLLQLKIASIGDQNKTNSISHIRKFGHSTSPLSPQRSSGLSISSSALSR